MNLSNPSTVGAARGSDAAARRDQPPRERVLHHPARDAFERALQARSAPREDDAAPVDEDDESSSGTGASVAPGASLPGTSLPAPAPFLRPPPGPPPATVGHAAGATPDSTGTRAAIEAALGGQPAPTALSAIAGTDPAALWQVSIGEPLGIPVELRAQRGERAAHEAAAPWALSLRASSLGAETLSRHVPRLHERLRKQGVELDHVRVERDEEEDSQP
jgi:hypothetical protein